MVDAQISTRLEDSIKKSFRSYTAEFEKKAKDKRKRYIDLVEKSVKEIIKDKDKSNTEDEPNVKEASKNDWFKKPERPPTPDLDWNAGKQIDFRPPQTCISKIANARKPHFTFDELIITPINFSAYVLNNLKIENLTQEYLVRPAFNLLKGTCKSRVELEYYLEECGSLSIKYTTSTTKTKAAKYDIIEGIKDMVPSLWSPVKSTKRIIAVTHVKVMNKYDYGYLDKIIIQREDQSLHKFIEGDFPRLNLRDIEDMLLLLVQKKLSNLERDDLFYLNVALQMFTKHVVILKRVKDLQLGVESYQKKLNITRSKTFMSDITKMTPYTTYNNPHGIIYQDKFQRNRLMRFDELYKFFDGTLSSV
ncbi:hypothetical protein Tco_1002968 [Tanacetum coccineum]|uniref:Uncharacterized protein n=1 Tax=Tanacetum coccineum TaxID=301880 RepID=A0ABQ5F834_9ASTR